MEKHPKVAVIGGGAAGFFAAVNIAELCTNAQVTIFEKNNHVLGKVKISGGGRCNITHNQPNSNILIQNYPRGKELLKSAFAQLAVADTVTWFASHGLMLKTEPDGRMFPVGNRSQEVIDLFINLTQKYSIKIHTATAVNDISLSSNKFEIHSQLFDYVIVTIGGQPKIQGYDMVSKLGHNIIAPVPSLFTFNVPNSKFTDLMGVSLPHANIKITGAKLHSQGAALFTHWGLSGPAVLKLSAWAARELYANNYHFAAILKMHQDYTEDSLTLLFLQTKENNKLKTVMANRLPDIPQRLWEKLCELSDIAPTLKWADMSAKKMNKLTQSIVHQVFEVKGKTTFKEEFVTAGGVNSNELNINTLESLIIPNLYFAGEVLDIDGITGGYNFQAAWSTAWVAANDISNKIINA
ncbi:MAG: NAD(P)/FAD-dependent oxidoreductase [Cytophagales bacterium]|nr:NAD(P)/FAD-dependent oxidoreductase [Cytophagales bacterium]